ncbi:MAG: VCBS repeat-containing protein [Planctomycetota bacterium]
MLDADGDGSVDVAMATGGGAFVHLNDGNAVFARQVLPSTGPGEGIDAGDVDGDGDADLVVTSSGDDDLLLNDGTGMFVLAPSTLPAIGSGGPVLLVDADGDGDLDCLRGTYDDDLSLFAGDGAGGFVDASGGIPSLPLGGEIQEIAAGDLDGDGVGDLYLAAAGSGDAVLLGTGGGSFALQPSGVLPLYMDDSKAASITDLDQDGDLDVCISAGGVFGDRLLENDGSASFADVYPSGYVHSFSDVVVTADLDANGFVDLMFARGAGRTCFLGNGSGGFLDVTGGLPQDGLYPTDLLVDDLDGDGDADVFAMGGAASTVLLGNGVGLFGEATAGVPYLSSSFRAATGDLDGDGDEDAVVGRFELSRFDNDGSGFLRQTTTAFASNGAVIEALALGDLDGDGDLDGWVGLSNTCGAFGSIGGLDDYTVRNDGTGSLQPWPGALPAGLSSTRDVALVDVDGDGDLDAATAAGVECFGESNVNGLFLNGGVGAFSAAAFPAPDVPSFAIAAADFDQDGDVDLLAGNGNPVAAAGTLQNSYFTGDGVGGFTDATALLPSILDNTQDLAVGDIDADGDLDVLVGNSGIVGPPCGLLRNEPAGFVDASASLPTTTQSVAVLLVDLNEDGSPDVFLGGVQDEVYFNDGSGSFALATGVLPEESEGVSDAVATDIDGDGDVDLLLSGSTRLHVNTTRQLAWRGTPRLGKPLQLDVYGPAAGVYGLAYSPTATVIPLAPFGVLRIDPATLLVFGSGSLDGAGEATAAFTVPATPPLVGVPMHWQALVGADFASLRFTNRETTTATDL